MTRESMKLKKTPKKKASAKKAPKTKAKAKTEAKAETPTNGHGNGHNNEPIVIEGQKHMTPLDLAQFQLLEQKWVNLQLLRKNKEREKVEAIQKIDNELAVMKIAELKAQREYLLLRSNFCKKYEVDFNDPGFSYDDETGRLILFEGKAGEPAPQA